jgi:hypothetical protein
MQHGFRGIEKRDQAAGGSGRTNLPDGVLYIRDFPFGFGNYHTADMIDTDFNKFLRFEWILNLVDLHNYFFGGHQWFRIFG